MKKLKYFFICFLWNCFRAANNIKIEELSYNRVPRKVFISSILSPIKSKIKSVKDFFLSPKVHGIAVGSIGIPLIWWHKFGKTKARKKWKKKKRE